MEKGKIILQEHVVEILKNYPNHILDKSKPHRFLGRLNYIRPFYEGEASDIHILQQRIEKNPLSWKKEISIIIQNIK